MVRKWLIYGWRATCLWLALALIVLAATSPLQAQTLARKGWAGSGISVDPWWKNSVFYELDPAEGFAGIVARLDDLQGLGVDAIVLSPFDLADAESGKLGFKAAYGTDNDFDRLQQEANRRKIRLVVELEQKPDVSIGTMTSEARFWLTRGVAGLLLTFPQTNGDAGALGPAERLQRVAEVHRLSREFAGERVVITQTGPVQVFSTSDPVVGPVGRRRGISARTPKSVGQPEQSADVIVDRRLDQVRVWNAVALQGIIFGNAPALTALLESDTSYGEPSWSRFSVGMDPANRLALAKMVAAMLFLGRESPLLFSGQESAAEPGIVSNPADSSSLISWYEILSKLRHQRAALHKGTLDAVETDYPDVVAWVRRGLGKEAPVLVLCNFSAQPRVVSVAEGLRRLGLSTANGVHVLALSSAEMSPSYSAAGVTLSPYGVYVAELRQPGLEDSPAPVVSHQRRR